MDVKIGLLVKVLAGKEKNTYYIVIGQEKDRILLTDGRKRKRENPKKKNEKHIQKTNQIFFITEKTTNNEIKRLLFPYNFGSAELSQDKKGEVFSCQNKM